MSVARALPLTTTYAPFSVMSPRYKRRPETVAAEADVNRGASQLHSQWTEHELRKNIIADTPPEAQFSAELAQMEIVVERLRRDELIFRRDVWSPYLALRETEQRELVDHKHGELSRVKEQKVLGMRSLGFVYEPGSHVEPMLLAYHPEVKALTIDIRALEMDSTSSAHLRANQEDIASLEADLLKARRAALAVL